MAARERKIGLVLSGAAALGAYEAGVVQYVLDDIAKTLGRRVTFDILSGTSAGGINAAALAATATDPAEGARRLSQIWAGLELGGFLHPPAIELLRALLDGRGGGGRLRREIWTRFGRVGLVGHGPLELLLASRLPFERITENVRIGAVGAVALSTTHIATGDAVVFYHAGIEHPPWPAQRGLVPRPTTLTLAHALASAAIPLLFPPVAIDGDLYCDGGLRQLVPLAPAIHLGATRILVVPPLPRAGDTVPGVEAARRGAVTSPIYLLGKALNALFLERVEADLDRLWQVNAVLRAGRERFGPAFEADLNDELERMGAGPIRKVELVRVDPARALGTMAIEYVQSRAFARQARTPAGRLLRCLAARDPARSGDLLSYLLFDGGFAAQLIELGRADAAARRDELCALFAPPLRAQGVRNRATPFTRLSR